MNDVARGPLTIRIRTAVRSDIERAAKMNGRSLSEEIEHRLELQMEFGEMHQRIAALEKNSPTPTPTAPIEGSWHWMPKAT